MLKVARRGLAARKRRAFTLVVAVFLGVALTAGAYVLTDTINASFEDIFEESFAGTDVAITPREIVAQDDQEPPAFDAGLLPRVERAEGVAKAEGGVFSLGRIVDQEGDSIGSEFAPNFISSDSSEPFDTLTYTEGHTPESDDQAAIDPITADRGDLGVGDRVGVVADRELETYEVVGIARLGETDFGGAAVVTLTLPEAQRVTGKEGEFDQISVDAADGVTPEVLAQRLDPLMPDTVDVRTGAQSAADETEDIKSDLGFLTIALLVFAGVAVVVGGFLIFNTFSITIAQRIREFGLLRTLGASRGQILGSVIVEALAIGAIGSLLGLAGGLAFAPAINALFEAVGIDLPNTGTVLATRTVIVALLVGIVITLLSALSPALRATRVMPMAALLEAELPEGHRRGRIASAVGVLLVVLGIVLVCIGLFGGIDSSSSAASLMGAGAAATLFGVAIFSPVLVRPLASVAGKPMERLRGLTGRLARENAMRKPGRTAATAAALMIGLALVSFVTVFAAGISSSVDDAVDTLFEGDVIVQNQDGFSPIPAAVADDVAGVEGVDGVTSLGYSTASVSGVAGEQRIAGVDPASVGGLIDFEVEGGSGPEELGRDEAVIDRAFGDSEGIGVGDTLEVLTPTGARTSYTVVGEVKDNADFLGSFVLTGDALREDFGYEQAGTVVAGLASGADAAATEDRVKQLVDDRYPIADAQDPEELKETQREQINQLLGLIYALLALAVIVSIFGIVNTLALSIHERTRELGLLRAIGMSRRQVRRVIRYEAVITALIGAILGSILGIVFSTLISRPLADEGFSLSFPVVSLVILLVLAALAGVLAAIGPARRASRLDVLEAVAYE
ncbi:MAG: ABC transporter permease [Solirubrobacterales bacterium]